MVTKPFILGLLLLHQLVRLVFCPVHEAASETFLSDASSSWQQGAAAEQTFPSGCWTQPWSPRGQRVCKSGFVLGAEMILSSKVKWRMHCFIQSQPLSVEGLGRSEWDLPAHIHSTGKVAWIKRFFHSLCTSASVGMKKRTA